MDGDEAGSVGLGTSRGETPGGEPGADGGGAQSPSAAPLRCPLPGSRGPHSRRGDAPVPPRGAFSVPSRPLTLSPLLCFISEIET